MKKETEKNCGSCIYNDDGLCDRLGRIVDDDDQRCNGKYWEEKEK